MKLLVDDEGRVTAFLVTGLARSRPFTSAVIALTLAGQPVPEPHRLSMGGSIKPRS